MFTEKNIYNKIRGNNLKANLRAKFCGNTADIKTSNRK